MLIDPAYWMDRAINLAEEAAAEGEVPVGAILLYKDEVIGQGKNARLSSSRTAAHAEMMALEDYNKRSGHWRVFPHTSLVVTVEPCLMCTGALLWARVDNIYYGCADPKSAGLLRLKPLIESGIYDHKFNFIQPGIRGEKTQNLMSGFFSTMRQEKKMRPSDSASSAPTSL